MNENVSNFIKVNYEKELISLIKKLKNSIASLHLNLNFCLYYSTNLIMMESERNFLNRTSPKRQNKLSTITDYSNPEDSFLLASQKKIRNTVDVLDQSQCQKDDKLNFRGRNRFIEFKDEKDTQMKPKFKNNVNDVDDISMGRLLEQCRQSILSLRRELSQKSLQLQLERSKVKQLETNLVKSQEQVARQHKLLSMYIENQKNTHSQQQYASLRELGRQDSLQHQNQRLNDQLKRLTQQNSQLKKKVSIMGNGVGKALETIRKRTESKESGQLNRQESIRSIKEKPSDSNRGQQYGKIVTRYRNRTSPGSIARINSINDRNPYTTPSKPSSLVPYNNQTQTKLSQSTQPTASTEFLMKLISTKAKYFTQLQKIQSLVEKMQNLAESQCSQHSDQESCHE